MVAPGPEKKAYLDLGLRTENKMEI